MTKLYGIYLRVFVTLNVIIMSAIQIFSAAIIAQFVYYCVNDIYYYGEETVSLFLIMMALQVWKLATIKASKLLVDITNM